MENSISGRTPMTAVTRITLTPGGYPPSPPMSPPSPTPPPSPPRPPYMPFADTLIPTCYFPMAGWCRGFDDCGVGYSPSPADCFNRCYDRYPSSLVAIDLDEFSSDSDCYWDYSVSPPQKLCHCCCQDACPYCVGSGTESLVIRADFQGGAGVLPSSCGNPKANAPPEYQLGMLDMTNCEANRDFEHHVLDTVSFDLSTRMLTVTIADRDADEIHPEDWCAEHAPAVATELPLTRALLLVPVRAGSASIPWFMLRTGTVRSSPCTRPRSARARGRLRAARTRATARSPGATSTPPSPPRCPSTFPRPSSRLAGTRRPW